MPVEKRPSILVPVVARGGLNFVVGVTFSSGVSGVSGTGSCNASGGTARGGVFEPNSRPVNDEAAGVGFISGEGEGRGGATVTTGEDTTLVVAAFGGVVADFAVKPNKARPVNNDGMVRCIAFPLFAVGATGTTVPVVEVDGCGGVGVGVVLFLP